MYERIHNKKIPIKTLLLDQTIISGLGNIYANEVLFASRINPQRLGCDISLDECQSIVNSSIKIINEAIENKDKDLSYLNERVKALCAKYPLYI